MNLTKQSVISLKGLLWGSEIIYIKCLTQKRSQYLIDIIINLIVILLCHNRCYKGPGDKEMKSIELYTLLQQTDRSVAYNARQNEVSTPGVEPEEWEVLQTGYVRPHGRGHVWIKFKWHEEGIGAEQAEYTARPNEEVQISMKNLDNCGQFER